MAHGDHSGQEDGHSCLQLRTLMLKTQEGTLVMNPRTIARKYVTSGWFFLDLLAGFPVLLIIKIASQGQEVEGQSLLRLNQTTKIFRIFRVLRVFRLVKLNRLFALLTDRGKKKQADPLEA